MNSDDGLKDCVKPKKLRDIGLFDSFTSHAVRASRNAFWAEGGMRSHVVRILIPWVRTVPLTTRYRKAHENLATPQLCTIGLRPVDKRPVRRRDRYSVDLANSELADYGYSSYSHGCGKPVTAVRIVGTGTDHSKRFAGLGHRRRSQRSRVRGALRHVCQQPDSNARCWGFNHSDGFRSDTWNNLLFR